MSEATTYYDGAALEQLIYQVRGVHAARLVTDTGGKINEVHVVGTPRRSAKQIVRDIESILYVRGGIRLDYRKISLVQVAESAVQNVAPRLQLIDVAHSAGESGTTVVVTLGLRDEQVQGLGVARPDVSQDEAKPLHAALPQLTAQATVNALDSWVGPRGHLQLERIQRQGLGAIEVYLAHLSLETDAGIETLLGVSMLRNDELLTVARAVLDAANRRVERLLAHAQ
jgi:hypothetical protein